MEEEGQDALEVGPQAHAAKDAQDAAEEGIEQVPIHLDTKDNRRTRIIY